MKLMTALAVFALSTGLAWGAGDVVKKEPSPAQKAQQEKMKSCNAEAGKQSLKGGERKKFMSECLSAKPAAPTTQQDKMKTCNAEAGKQALQGDERKKFMSECLKGAK